MPSGDAELKVQIGGKPIPRGNIFEIFTDSDRDQPDMAAVALDNVVGDHSGTIKHGDELKVLAGGETLFHGDIVGIEPIYDHDLPSRVYIRALNRMHRLSRGRKSRSFENMSDRDIVNKICQEAGLSATCEGASQIPHDHVYQHNQTDLEFIRQRAARIGCEVWVDGTQLFFGPRKIKGDSGVKLEFRKGGDSSLIRFRPRLSTAHQVSKVICRGWDPIKKKEIVGIATPQAEFGGTSGASVAQQAFGAVETLEVERPVYTQEEADAMAKAILKDRMMTYITGEAVCHGMPSAKAGSAVTIDVPDSRFKGKYYVAGVCHRYIHSTAQLGGVAHKEAGYKTILRLQRDAES